MSDIKQNTTQAMTSSERGRRWREKNAHVLETRFKCDCGSSYFYTNKTQHLRTQKHLRFVQYQQDLNSVINGFNNSKQCKV